LNSRDFTYIDNVIQANHLAALVNERSAINEVYNVAHGERTSLNQLFEIIRSIIGRFNKEVLNIQAVHGPERVGDIPHSHASIEKSRMLLGYQPAHTVIQGMEEAVKWYRENL